MVRGMLSEEYGYQSRRRGLKLILRFVERLGFKVSDQIVVVSRTLGERIQRHFAVDKRKIVHLPNEIPSLSGQVVDVPYGERLWEEKLPGGGVRLFSGGVITAVKNFEMLFEAIKALSIPCHLCIAGMPASKPDHEYFIALKARAKRLGIEDRVTWLGWLSRDKLLGVIKSSHLYIGSSHREGMSNILLEALAVGTPCVAKDTRESRELLGSDLLLFETPSELVEIIERYYHDERYAEDIVERAKAARDSWTFDWDQKLLELFTKGLGYC